MRKLILVVQTSFDGFVAGPNGEFDNFIGDDEGLEYVCSLIDEGDAILMGRISFQLLNSNWPTAATKPNATKSVIKYSNWYNTVPKIVISKTLKSTNQDLTIINQNVESEVFELKKLPGKSILIFGSPTTSQYLLDLKLIDGIYLLLHPVIFGTGIPLFKQSKTVTKLKLLDETKLSNGILGLKYLTEN